MVSERADVASYVPNILPPRQEIDYVFANQGQLDLVRAGQSDELFAERVRDFDWQKFYEDLGGNLLIQAMGTQLRESYDWVLLDSRTGLSDTMGICTVVLPDLLVNCFAPNRQSIRGAAAVAASVHRARPDLPIYPVACRIERAEHDRLTEVRALWRGLHAASVERLELEGEGYWDRAEIPYVPVYAFQEVLSALVDTPGVRDTALAAYEQLTSVLSAGKVRRLAPPVPQIWRPASPPTVVIASAVTDPEHVAQVRSLWTFLREQGLDASLGYPLRRGEGPGRGCSCSNSETRTSS